jgi:type VI secretion system protein ImpK
VNHDDYDSDRTIVKPMPGRGPAPGAPARAPGPPPPPPPGPAPVGPPAPAYEGYRRPPAEPYYGRDAVGAVVRTGVNPLVRAGASLFGLVGQLQQTPTHHDVEGLRNRVIDEIRGFEGQAREQDMTPEMVNTARYALCSLIDETVLGTPWGSASWSSRSLLSVFYGERFGGEKFFPVLQRLLQAPSQNVELLEFMYVCLALGFEGKFRLESHGSARLETLRDEVARSIRNQRGDYERELSPHWQGLTDRRNPLVRYVPLWVVGALAGALLLALYLGFQYVLSSSSEPVQAELESVARPLDPLP